MQRRGVLGLLAAGVAMVVLTGMVMAIDRSGLINALATDMARARGYPEAQVTVHRLEWGRGEATVRLDPARNEGIERLALTWSLDSLRHRRLEGVMASGVRLRLSVDSNGTGGSFPDLPAESVVVEDAVVTVERSVGPIVMPIAGTVTARRDDGMLHLNAILGPVDLAALRTEPAVTGRGTAMLEVGGLSWSDLAGVLRLQAEGAVEGMAEKLALDGRASVAMNGGWVRLAPDGCTTVTVERLTFGRLEVRPVKPLCLGAPDGGAMATVSPAGVVSLFLETVAGTPMRLVLDQDGGPLAATTTLASGALVHDPARAEKPALRLVLADIRLKGDQAPLVPLDAEGDLHRTAEGILAFTVTARDASGRLRLTAIGRHEAEKGGEATIKVAPVRFDEEHPPGDLFPALRPYVTRAGGRVALNGHVDWDADGTSRAGAEVLLRDLMVEADGLAAEGIDGVIRARTLFPLVVPAGQLISVDLLDVGVPLTAGEIRFGVRPGGLLDIEEASWRWAGGVVRAESFQMRLPALKGSAMLRAEGLDLGQVLSTVAVEGLSATGTLQGELPVRSNGRTVSIHDGLLEATEPGVIRYDPATPPSFLQGTPGSGTDLLMQALTNFRYDSLKMTLNGAAGGETRLGLGIRGNNPDFYGGYPVALNLNVTGALDTILRRGLRTYRIPDAVRERMMDFERHGQ
ncbi:MAG TPA: YdbH domain-containing protein [Azospirillaceae bacterium]|nr:YdbH domain-containing protein [Azospirillaceae bacterium]